MYPYNQALREFSQELRKNMTPEEKHLWYDFLKLLPMTVKRQQVVSNYILDFFIPSVNISLPQDRGRHGERIAQLAIVPFLKAEFEESDGLSDTVRGAGGFGSTRTK